jgi:tetratricopeptide (TPR) repeat protein
VFKHQTFYELACADYLGGNYEKAKAYIQEALELSPGNKVYLEKYNGIVQKIK